MNPALKPILAVIESAAVRIEYARDDEHALNEAIQLAAEVRSLLRVLGEQVAFTETDPVPRRNCLTCAECADSPGVGACRSATPGVSRWVFGAFHGSAMDPDADNCPGYTLRVSAPVVDDVPELARRCGLVADIKGRDEDEWAYLVEDTGAVRIAHTSWWDRNRDKKREPGWAIFEDWRLFATIEDAVRAYAADHTLPRVGARITAPL